MRYYRRRNWGAYQVSKRQELTYLFAGIDREIQEIFLNLSPSAIDSLFYRYGKIHGKSAERYARKTFPKWKSRETKLSGQTAERLLNLIPHYLSKEKRYELVKKLRKHYMRKMSRAVTASPSDWQNAVLPIINEFVEKSKSFQLPNTLIDRASWLADGDASAANRILCSIEEEETQIRTNYLKIEFKRIEALISNLENLKTINHLITLPQGNIFVTIQQEKQPLLKKLLGGNMSNNEKDLVSTAEMQAALVNQQQRGNLLNIAIDDLTVEKKNQLKAQIIQERMKLDVNQAHADQRFQNSTRDMANTIKAVNAIEQSSKSDFDIKSTFNTASGKTDIHIKKNNNTVIIVVCVVIGILVLMMVK